VIYDWDPPKHHLTHSPFSIRPTSWLLGMWPETDSHLPRIPFIRWDEKAGLQRDAICSPRSTRSKRNGKETGL
jgi:hypothetical protein